VAAALSAALTGCSDDDAEALNNDPPASAAPGGVDLTKKPAIEVPEGPPPTTLQISDIVTGTGAEAVPGKEITVKYVGVTYADGKEFDASWGGQDFTFPLGAGRVIQGWDEGFAGMKEGGRRQLVIPPALGYGPGGSGPIPPNATLIFVVDLVKVG
jgi:peptidylprolyl isomerase